MTPASRRASRQIAHSSSSVRLKQRGHGLTFSASVVRAVASRWLCSGDCLSRWYVNRSAVLRPIPGSLDSSPARSSIAPTLERQLEGEVQASGQAPHFSLGEVGGLLLRFVYRDEYEVFEHLDVLGIRHARIDLHPRNGPLSVRVDGYHPSARGRGNGLLLQLGLHLLHPRLHLLGLFENLAEISHRRRLRVSESVEQLEIELV